VPTARRPGPAAVGVRTCLCLFRSGDAFERLDQDIDRLRPLHDVSIIDDEGRDGRDAAAAGPFERLGEPGAAFIRRQVRLDPRA
jgi:hypothetical protein